MNSDNSIERSFSNAAQGYDSNALLQHSVAKSLLERFSLQYTPQRILELGCGTGFLTAMLSDKFPESQIDALDLSAQMVSAAQKRVESSRVKWHVINAMEYRAAEQYDLIISSSAMQWMNPISRLIANLRGLSAEQGEVHFSIMLKGTLCELHRLREEIAPDNLPLRELPDFSIIIDALREGGFCSLENSVDEVKVSYPNSLEFLRTLKRLGLTGGDLSRGGRVLLPGEISKIAKRYQSRYSDAEGAVAATYRVGYFRCSC